MVRANFCEQDASLILTIHEDMEDEWAWHFDDKGIFSVKSAYKLQRQLDEVHQGQQESLASLLAFSWK
jgi:hypothetical protein